MLWSVQLRNITLRIRDMETEHNRKLEERQNALVAKEKEIAAAQMQKEKDLSDLRTQLTHLQEINLKLQRKKDRAEEEVLTFSFSDNSHRFCFRRDYYSCASRKNARNLLTYGRKRKPFLCN